MLRHARVIHTIAPLALLGGVVVPRTGASVNSLKTGAHGQGFLLFVGSRQIQSFPVTFGFVF